MLHNLKWSPPVRLTVHPSLPCQPPLQRWPHHPPPCFLTPLHPAAQPPWLVLHLPGAPGMLLCGWASGGLVNLWPMQKGRENGRAWWGHLVRGPREQKVVQAVGLHKCDTHPQAQDFEARMKKKNRKTSGHEVGEIFILSWCASDAVFLWKQVQYFMWFLAYVMFDLVNLFVCIIKKSACSNFALCLRVCHTLNTSWGTQWKDECVTCCL